MLLCLYYTCTMCTNNTALILQQYLNKATNEQRHVHMSSGPLSMRALFKYCWRTNSLIHVPTRCCVHSSKMKSHVTNYSKGIRLIYITCKYPCFWYECMMLTTKWLASLSKNGRVVNVHMFIRSAIEFCCN